MNWDSIQQLVRIVAYAVGGYLLGDAVANSEQFQAAVGGLVSVGAFAWWFYWERKRA
jgi:hypothetical protein